MEEWRAVIGYDERYEVSNEGRVRNAAGLILKPEKHYGGYLKVDLCLKGVCKKKFVHRLVAFAFLGAPDDPAYVVNHIDGVKHHNNWMNLEWMSSGDNTRHYFKGVRQVEIDNQPF